MGFLSSYDGELREPLLWHQASPVSIRVARGSAALLSIHGRGIGPQRVEEGISSSFSSCGRKPWVPLTCAGDLMELLRVTLRSRGYCGVGRGLLDSTGFGAMEEGLISS